ncbi:MAG TPA: hypothetical protein EYN34_03505 [Aquifex sp.]|nr:hypothetical protein [Aquifex sp.]
MQNAIANPLEEIKQEVVNILKKHNISWSKLDIYETSDGYLVLVRTPQFKDHIETIELSLKLEEELKDPLVTLSILPAE